MVDLYFIERFIAEFALVINFLPLLMIITNFNSNKIIIKSIIGIAFVSPFFMNWISIAPVWNIVYYSIFVAFGVNFIMIPLIKHKGELSALCEYHKNPAKPQYGINDTLERFNDIINLLLMAIFGIVALLAISGMTIIIAMIIILSTVFIAGNYYVSGHRKFTTCIKPKKVQVNMYTLLGLSLLLSLTILCVWIFAIREFYPAIFDTYPIAAGLVIFPQLFLSYYVLNRSRLTFFRKEKIKPIFIRTYFINSMISLLLILVLSDAVVVYLVVNAQDIMSMVMWVYGFILFLGIILIQLYQKYLVLSFESGLITASKIKKSYPEETIRAIENTAA